MTKTYLATPLAFERNPVWSGIEGRYLARGGGYTMLLTSRGAVLNLRQGGRRAIAAPVSTLRMKLVGAATVSAMGQDLLPGVSNYLIGSDRSKCRTGVGRFARVLYQGVYPGIDLVYYGKPAPTRIRLRGGPRRRPPPHPHGVRRCESHAAGCERRPGAHLRRRRTAPAQAAGLPAGRRRPARYDERKPLVVDPKISYSTCLGSSSDDGAFDITADDKGNAYVVGITGSSGFPTQDARDTSFGPNPLGIAMAFGDALVTKIAADGKTLVYSTFLSGNGADGGNAIAIDSTGNVVVCGATSSTDFPLSKNAYQTSLRGSIIQNAMFVTKLNAAGNGIL